jgi:ubiquinone/menaquinone biosynthesis C-methylase UbiE/cytosine/adenosine deaminase-related metal-dependent hydrolase
VSRTLHLPAIEAHALWAARYDETPNPILSLEERQVGTLLPPVEGMDVLDVACGTGRWLARLMRRGVASAVGLDLSTEMLQQARRKPGLRMSLLHADAMEMPLPAASFDVALCSFGLSYMTNIRLFAKEISRVVKDRGHLLLTDFHPSAEARGWKRSFRHERSIVEVSSFPRSIAHIQETFEENGFELVVCLEPSFGEAERSIFEKCGKVSVFDQLLGQPAIVVLLFRRTGKPLIRKSLTRPFGPPSPAGRGNVQQIVLLPPGEGGPKGRMRDFPDHNQTSTWFVGGRIALDARTSIPANLEISGGRIRTIVADNPPDTPNITTLNLRNYLILPGLINSHDHLEFNLFPRLGRGGYSNSADWAHDIYHPQRSPVRDHLSVPKKVRLWWGGLKNLLSGVTTVCHHNPWDRAFEQEFPVQVVRRYGWAHSMMFDKNVLHAFASTEPDGPFIIHAGEGTDQRSGDEVFELDRIGALDSRTVLVHGVAFSEAGHALRDQRGASLVWCPTSNRFILGTTLNIHSVGNLDKVALGTDSTLTGKGGLHEEIQAAREEGASPDSIYRMVTDAAASIFHLKNGEGTLRPNAIANLIAIPWNGSTPADALMQMDVSKVEMVVVSGRLHLASDEVLRRCYAFKRDGLQGIAVDRVRRWVRAPIPWLVKETTAHLGKHIRLAGMRVYG